VSAQQMADGGSLLNLILWQAEAIKFASDWKKIGLQRGGKKYKGAYARSVYESRTGQRPPDMNHSTKEERTAFKAFKIRQQNLITSRNYLNSSAFRHCWIPCGVQTNLGAVQHRFTPSSPSFKALGHQVFRHPSRVGKGPESHCTCLKRRNIYWLHSWHLEGVVYIFE
jgi:hypothetical protein